MIQRNRKIILKPEKHFLSILHVKAIDAATNSSALESHMRQKQLDLRKGVGQSYDGAATFSGKVSGVQKRIQTLAAHSGVSTPGPTRACALVNFTCALVKAAKVT